MLKKRRKQWFIFLLFVFLLGCSDDPAKEVVNVPVIGPEEHENQMELPTEITFPVDGKSYTIPLGNAPTLAYYIASTPDVDETVSTFKGTTIAEVGNSSLIIMSYACQKQDYRCSYFLIKDGTEEKNIVPLTDLAKYVNYTLSPNEDYLVVQFERTDANDILTNHLLAIDVEEMEIVPLKNDKLSVDLLNYNYPIFKVEFIENEKLQVEVPTYSNEEPALPTSETNTILPNDKVTVTFEL